MTTIDNDPRHDEPCKFILIPPILLAKLLHPTQSPTVEVTFSRTIVKNEACRLFQPLVEGKFARQQWSRQEHGGCRNRKTSIIGEGDIHCQLFYHGLWSRKVSYSFQRFPQHLRLSAENLPFPAFVSVALAWTLPCNVSLVHGQLSKPDLDGSFACRSGNDFLGWYQYTTSSLYKGMENARGRSKGTSIPKGNACVFGCSWNSKLSLVLRVPFREELLNASGVAFQAITILLYQSKSASYSRGSS